MPDQIPYIRVFLSSPGDVTDERKIALDVIDRLPNRPAFRERVAFRIIAWDKLGAGTPMRATLTPQEAINQGLPKPSECDIVIVLFWSRMGTPFIDSDGKTYLSGTHWELLDGLQSERAETVIYRRTEERLFKSDDREGAEQAERVKSFFRSELFYKDGRIVRGINSYQTPDEFRQSFETDFEDLVVKLLKKLETSQQVAEPQLPTLPQIRTAIPTDWLPDKSPFPGLTRFTEADAEIFFGRGREIDALVRKVEENRFVAIVGASGSGKSSLVGAGLIPRLRANAISGTHLGSQDWFIARFTPGQSVNPFEALGAALIETIPAIAHQNPLTYAKDLEAFAADLEARPDRLVKTLDHALKNEKAWAEILLFIDQFEELFTLAEKDAGKETVQAFTLLLAEAAKSPRIRIVVTLRADFYQRAVPYQELTELLRTGSFPLAAPKREALREMIVRPAERANLTFETGLVARILEETGDAPGNLALLAYLLEELYRQRDRTRQLTEAIYERLGGVQGAIGQRAEALFEKLKDTIHDDTLAVVFRELVDVDERGEATRQRALVSTVVRDKASEQLVSLFASEQARLLIYDKDTEGRPTIEIAHEAIFHQWTRLREWIEKEQNNLRLHHQVSQDAQQWDKQQRHRDYLWKGKRLDEAQQWTKSFPTNDLVKIFIKESLDYDLRNKQRSVVFRVVGIIVGIILLVTVTYSIVSSNARFNTEMISLEVAYQGTLVAGLVRAPTYTPIRSDIFGTPLPATIIARATLEQATAQAVVSWPPTVVKNADIDMVLVPPGCFWMGMNFEFPEKPAFSVCFANPYWIDRYEVTNEQFQRFVEAKNYENNDKHYWTDAGWQWIHETTSLIIPSLPTDAPTNAPRVNISWYEAWAFCVSRRDDTRLPTESEWEYAARSPLSFIYPWGNEFKSENIAISGTPEKRIQSVGSHSGDESWVGARDMSGSVLEWTSTIFRDYPYNADTLNASGEDIAAATGHQPMVVRSAYFKNFPKNNIAFRLSARVDYSVDGFFAQVGFRCMRPAKQGEY